MKPIVSVSATSFCGNSDLVEDARRRFPDITFKFCSPQQQWNQLTLSEFLSGSSGWIVGKEPVSDDLLKKIPGLRVISKYGVGIDNIDFAACDRRGVAVYFESGVNSQEVAELTLGLMISASRNIGKGLWHLKQGRWVKDGGQNFSGKKVGIVGFGHVGSKVAALCKSFGCQVLVNDIQDYFEETHQKGYKWLDLGSIVAESDILSFHVPLTEKTRSMLSGPLLNSLSPNVIVVNTSRGEVIDQKALTKMLAEKRIRGLALDVYTEEPLKDNSLYSQDDFIGTAHIAGNSREAVWKMGQAALNGIKKILLDQ